MNAAKVRALPPLLLAVCLAAPGSAQELPRTMDPPPHRPPAEAPAAAEPADSLPPDEAACRERLRGLGVAFAEAERIDAPEGCAAAHPITVSQLPGGVALRPEAVLTCAMAEATAGFVRDHAAPLVAEAYGTSLAAVEQASSYVCRQRRGTRKLSEHAFANALDIGALVLEDGTRIEVRAHDPSREPRHARLLAALRKAACGPFATVLGPGSDADHADHFHFDMAERRSPFCQ